MDHLQQQQFTVDCEHSVTMKVSRFQIELIQNPCRIFFPGDTVHGVVLLQLEKPVKVKGESLLKLPQLQFDLNFGIFFARDKNRGPWICIGKTINLGSTRGLLP